MAASSFFLLSLILLLHNPHTSTANLHRINLLKSELISDPQPLTNIPPTRYFEVTKPIELPNTKPYSYLILQHDFAYTYGKPPVLANYTPPSDWPSTDFSKIVLEWTSTCKGRQFDRIFGVWLGGVELLRSCTAEPRATGIVWSVEKDVTRYYSLFKKNQTLTVYLGNVVDSTYTGIYHVNVTIHFYPGKGNLNIDESNLGDLDSGYGSHADLVLPISRNMMLDDGLWFKIENSTDVEVKEFRIPQNVYRAVLEVYVSFHEKDEFWYGNLWNDYISANNLTDTPGNGPFREVVVSLDGEIVGAIWPFTVIFTGGVNPLLWRPITGLGSFDLPTYDIEITPYLGKILDGKTHKFGFSVTNALNVWYVDANLHLWLDDKCIKTEGELLSYSNLPLLVSTESDFEGLNGIFSVNVSRSLFSTGWVKSSYGKITTQSTQDFKFSNSMVLGKDGNLQIVNQTIDFNVSVSAKTPSSHGLLIKSYKRFLLFLYSDYLDQGSELSRSVANVKLGFNERISKGSGSRLSASSLKNLQIMDGYMVVKNRSVVGGLGNTHQVYKYDGSNLCYFRNVSSSNYTILYDEVRDACDKSAHSSLGFGLNRWLFPARRASLASDLPVASEGV